jgi:2-dehydropantoate 2-reductase
VITGFEIVTPGHIKITVSADAIHLGAAVVGTIPPAVEALAAAIDLAGLPCLAVADIYQDLYAKLLYNCALNPLGAILGVHYGALVESEETRTVMDKVIEETFAVIRALGGKTPWADADAYKKVFYERLVPITYDHRPSMLQDLENGKPTEVEALVGYVSTQGRSTGVPTPACDLLSSLVRFKQGQAGR